LTNADCQKARLDPFGKCDGEKLVLDTDGFLGICVYLQIINNNAWLEDNASH
jgi:hypothetical protein